MQQTYSFNVDCNIYPASNLEQKYNFYGVRIKNSYLKFMYFFSRAKVWYALVFERKAFLESLNLKNFDLILLGF
jgi:hypothetical protein